MTRSIIVCCIVVSALVTVKGQSVEETASTHTARSAEYDSNSVKAFTFLQDCQKSLANKDAATMMKTEKAILDVACDANLSQMEMFPRYGSLPSHCLCKTGT